MTKLGGRYHEENGIVCEGLRMGMGDTIEELAAETGLGMETIRSVLNGRRRATSQTKAFLAIYLNKKSDQMREMAKQLQALV